MKVLLREIDLNSSLQAREEPHAETVDYYAGLLKAGIVLPPLLVYENFPDYPKKYSLLDGLQTAHAALNAGIDSIEIELNDKCSDLERFADGVKRNSKHGLALSAKDRKRAVEKIFSLDETHRWSSGYIASIVGCSDRTVENYRKQFATPKFSGFPEERLYKRMGKIQTMAMPSGKPTTGPDTAASPAEPPMNPPAQPLTLLDEVKRKSAELKLEGIWGKPLLPLNPPEEKVKEGTEVSLEDRKRIFDPLRKLAGASTRYADTFYLFSDHKQPVTEGFMEKLESQIEEILQLVTEASRLVIEMRRNTWPSN